MLGRGAVGSVTDVTLTQVAPGAFALAPVTLHFVNQFADEYAGSAGKFTLASDPSGGGVLLRLAASA